MGVLPHAIGFFALIEIIVSEVVPLADPENAIFEADGRCQARSVDGLGHCHLALLQDRAQALRRAALNATLNATQEEQHICTIWDGPRVNVFDKAGMPWGNFFSSFFEKKPSLKADLNASEVGDIWIMKSDILKIQGRYNKHRSDGGDSKTYLKGIAVSGPLIHNNILVIGTTGRKCFWNDLEILPFEEHPFRTRHFRAAGLIHAKYSYALPLVEDEARTTPGIEVDLPGDVKLTVNRHYQGLGLAIAMKRAVDGQDGLCGNFNHDHTDDTAENIAKRFRLRIPEHDVLFKHNFDGPSGSSKETLLYNHGASNGLQLVQTFES